MADVMTSPPVGVPVDRAALARRVLRLAEERTGASRWVPPRPALPPDRPGTGATGTVPVDAPAATGPVGTGIVGPGHVGPGPGSVDGLEPPEVPEPGTAARLLPVGGSLGGLLPRGGLERGSTVVVTGSTSLVLGMLAEASRAGGWVAVVGLPDAGVLAAHGMGLDLDRVVLVPAPGVDAPHAIAALLDGVDAVVVGPAAVLTDADRRRLAARARERAAVLLPTTAWPGAHVVLSAGRSRWEGVGRGDGRLRSRRLVVDRSGRGVAARSHRLDVVLPSGPTPWVEPEGLPVLGADVAPGCTADGVLSLAPQTPAADDGALLPQVWSASRRAG